MIWAGRFHVVLVALGACTELSARAQAHFAVAHHCKQTLVAVKAAGANTFEVAGCGYEDVLSCDRSGCMLVPPPPTSLPSEQPASLPTEWMRLTMQTRKAAMRACYERSLRSNAALAGRLYVQLTIEADGHVSQARIERTTLHDQTFETCVANEAKQLQFPARDEGMSISYPLDFKP